MTWLTDLEPVFVANATAVADAAGVDEVALVTSDADLADEEATDNVDNLETQDPAMTLQGTDDANAEETDSETDAGANFTDIEENNQAVDSYDDQESGDYAGQQIAGATALSAMLTANANGNAAAIASFDQSNPNPWTDLANWQAAAQATQQASQAAAQLTQSTALDNAQASEEEGQSDATTAQDDAQAEAEETQTDGQAEAADSEALAQAAATDAVFSYLPDTLVAPSDGPAPALAPDYVWGYEASDYYLYPTFGSFGYPVSEFGIGWEDIQTSAPSFTGTGTNAFNTTAYSFYIPFTPHDIVRNLTPDTANYQPPMHLTGGAAELLDLANTPSNIGQGGYSQSPLPTTLASTQLADPASVKSISASLTDVPAETKADSKEEGQTENQTSTLSQGGAVGADSAKGSAERLVVLELPEADPAKESPDMNDDAQGEDENGDALREERELDAPDDQAGDAGTIPAKVGGGMFNVLDDEAGTSASGSGSAETPPAKLNVPAVLQLLNILRPDVFQWFMQNGTVDTRDASSLPVRWMLSNVRGVWEKNGGKWTAHVTLDENMSEMEAAQALINRIEGGTLNLDFAPPFRANKALAGNDLSDPEEVQRWRKWVLQQTAGATQIGADMYVKGVAGLGAGSFVVGVHEAFEGNYFAAAMQIVPLLPLGKAAEYAAGKITFQFGKESLEVSADIAADLARLSPAEHRALLTELRAAKSANDAEEILLKVLPHADASTLCFARSTPVACAEGLKAIGEIVAGELVKAFDFINGEWVLAEVLKRHDNVYSGAVVIISAGGSCIEATLNHPFWVVKGNELEQRRGAAEAEGSLTNGPSLVGRWVLSQDLQAGDLLLSHEGKYLHVERIEQRFESGMEVSNLTIRDHHNFAVGNEPVLVHNTGFCDILRKAKGGYENMDELVAAAKRAGVEIHAHHIVLKGEWNHNSLGPFVKRAQAVLSKYMDVMYDTRNLTWALNRDHSVEYVKAVAEAVEAADAAGGEVAVVEVLERIAGILNKGEEFRGFGQ